jgi:hypothetical protein
LNETGALPVQLIPKTDGDELPFEACKLAKKYPEGTVTLAVLDELEVVEIAFVFMPGASPAIVT